MFVNHLASLTGEDGSQKYPILTSLYSSILAISHGNSAPENDFSINKNMLEVHGNSIEPETNEALRLVKDTILTFDSIVDIAITRDFIGSVKSARQRYFADLEIKKKLKDQESDCVQTKENANNEFAQESIRNAIEQVQTRLSVADELVDEGNDQLKGLLIQKNSTRKDLIAAQTKIEAGAKRRKELLEEQAVLSKRKKEKEEKGKKWYCIFQQYFT